MNDFEYYAPTHVVFGKNAESKLGELIKATGCKKALIHYGGGSVVRSGLLDRVKSTLNSVGVGYAELGGVVPNPRLSLVYRGIELCNAEGVDFILAVGGGSVIDSAKGIAYGVKCDFDVWDLYTGAREATGCLPVGVVLTIAAAGSEMSSGSVITKEEGWIKTSYNNNMIRPVFAVMNPELTLTLPAYQTACGCTDILMHTLERYFTSKGNMELTDSIAESLLRTVIKYARILTTDPTDYEARAEIMWAGSLSHNDLTECGNGGNDFTTHALEHELGGMFDVAHGAGLAALWGSWARYVLDDCTDRFYKFAINVMGIKPSSKSTKKSVALKGIVALESFFREIGMPTNIRELGVSPTDEQLIEMAHKCAISVGGSRGAAKTIYEPDMLAIYRAAL